MKNLPVRFITLVFALLNLTLAKGKMPSPCYFLELTSIGFPTAEKMKDAWTVNDLFFFDNKLYLGHGDAVVNTGPTDIIYYDFEQEEFITEFTIDDEAIYLYQIIDDKLMIPGIDATEDWSFGNFYTLTDTGWIKRRTVPNGIHVNYLASFDEKLFASAGTFGKIGENIEHYFGGIFSSVDTGKTWTLSYATPSDDRHIYRVQALVVYEGKLFAFPYAFASLQREEIPEEYHEGLSEKPYSEGYYLIFAEDAFGTCEVLVYDGKTWRCEDILPKAKLCYISKPSVFQSKLILPTLAGEYIDYINSKNIVPDQAIKELFAFDGKNTKKIKLDYTELTDLLIKEETLYLLIKKEEFYYIAKTNDLKKWEYFLLPAAIQNPRSLEFNDGIFYIGEKNGNIFKSVSSEPTKTYAKTEDFLPKNIFGAAELPRDGRWYWVAITEWENWGKLAKISAQVRFGKVIKINTENIIKMSIFIPWYHLDSNHEIMVIIDDIVVYEGGIDDINEFICTKTTENSAVAWEIDKETRTVNDYIYTKKIIGTTEIELTKGVEDPLVGCWKAEVLRWAVDADIAIIPQSEIREDLITSYIYLEDIFDTHHRNIIYTFEATGKEIKEMLEFNLQNAKDKRCYIAGFTFKYREKNSRKNIVEYSLLPEKKYTVATEDFLAKKAKRFFDTDIEYTNTKKDVYDAIIEWFNKFKVIKEIAPGIEKLP